ncbi:adenosylcobinamide-phosphate synthase CbiB [Peribacillus simplex]|uniref:adenosylcobinamide-phosphate synthase CbiB n=1 Tax=Peribacillus simplex TaxID=1478 RepID=UPI002E2472ED|nr:adenosylcobinamide-phosphate synthase CbiB [Peribacillus simplex]MED3983295.1 adenosylcobinamide-phosphate synthase CbiB [Peribacillus simplex]MED4092395.1 adenosylcobinamide-phosphate synthase CbiB [Peribacillus simplex]
MIYHHLLAVTLAFFLDLLIGDPPNWPHPVKWIGTIISKMDLAFNRGTYKKRNGLFMLIIVLSVVLLITGLTIYLAYRIHPLAGILWEAVVISTTIAQKGLKQAGMDVCLPLNDRDFPEARLKLSYIVGRDTADLDESEIVRGTVETVAENTSDGITAPMFWAAFGGAPLAMVYRAINTCDSMVGYKNDKYGQFGWASAKLDDIVNWIPSRLTGFLMLLSSKSCHHGFGARWKILFNDAKKHPSPNSGWCEAGVAAILGIQLGGRNMYKGIVSDRARMGVPLVRLEAKHIPKTITIMHRSSFLFLLMLWLGGLILDITFSWL